MEQGVNMQMPATEKSGGPVVGIIVVIIVLAIGAYYLFAELQSQKMMRELDSTTPTEELSDSNEVPALEADVTAEQGELDALDAELNALDSEL